MPWSPFMRSIVLTPITTPKSLASYLAALDPNLPTRLANLYLELDLTAVGNVYIGNSSAGALLSATNCGRHLVPAQNQNIAAFPTQVVLSTDIFIVTDNNNNQMNVIALPIGM